MAAVRQWIGGFLKRHQARFLPHDWPKADDADESKEFIMTWVTAFATREVTEGEADEASRLLGPTPPNFRRQHLEMVVGMIEAQRKMKGEPAAGTSTREFARDASRDCPYCGGDGLAMAWAERPDPGRRISETVAAFCVCPHGKFMKRTHTEKSPENLRKILDFGQVLDGFARGWLEHPPGHPEMAVGYQPPAAQREPEPEPEDFEPSLAVAVPFSRREVNEMFRAS